MKDDSVQGQRGHRENDGDIAPNMANGWETIQYAFVGSNATMAAQIQTIPLLLAQSKGMAVLKTALGLINPGHCQCSSEVVFDVGLDAAVAGGVADAEQGETILDLVIIKKTLIGLVHRA